VVLPGLSRRKPDTRLELVLLDRNLSFTGSPRFAKIHNNDGFENRRTKIKENYEQFYNCAKINTGCDVKKQHVQSDMKAISI
jgi:hypothetical protein